MNLSKHILELINYHECVIIPDFGAFISNYKSATFDPKRNFFFPPSKELIFNSKITKNDGLLINHLVEAEGIGYHQAEKFVSNFTSSLYRRLNNGETIELEELGSLRFDRSGTVIFELSGELQLLNSYGLQKFEYPTLYESINNRSFYQQPGVGVLNNKGNFIRIAASVALVIALSLFPVKTDKIGVHTSTLNPVDLLVSEPETMVQQNKEELATENPTAVKVVDEKLPAPYILVGGCFQYESNAKQFEDQLKSTGFNPEIVLLENGLYRVIVDSFNTKENALNAMNTYRQNHDGSGVWVSTR